MGFQKGDEVVIIYPKTDRFIYGTVVDSNPYPVKSLLTERIKIEIEDGSIVYPLKEFVYKRREIYGKRTDC